MAKQKRGERTRSNNQLYTAYSGCNKMAAKTEESDHRLPIERLHKIYKGELKVETSSYRDILDYFIKLPKTDMAPLVPSNDSHRDNMSVSQTDESSSDESSNDDITAHGP
jgi:hypothetical protein